MQEEHAELMSEDALVEFAFANAALENPDVTEEMIRKYAQAEIQKHVQDNDGRKTAEYSSAD